MAIKIEFLSDVSKVVRGAKDISKELDDVAGSLDDVGKGGEGLDVKVSDSFRTMGDEAKKGGKKAAEGAEEAVKGSSESMKTVSEETRQNISETVSSFRGDIEDIPQLVQDVAGGVVSDLGPVGAIVGTAFAAGIGLAVGALQQNAEEVAKNKELVIDLAGAINEAGGDLSSVDFEKRMQEWGHAIQDTKEWWELFQDDAKTGFEVIQEGAKKAGVVWTDAFRGTHGSMGDSQKFLEDTAATFKVLEDAVNSSSEAYNGQYSVAVSNATAEQRSQFDALQKLRDEAQKNIGTQQAAQKVQEDGIALSATATRFIGGETEAQKRNEDATRRNTEAKQEQYAAVQALADEQDRAAGKVKDAITAENDLAQAHADAKQALIDNGRTVDVNTEKGRANRQMLLDLATAVTDHEKAQIAQGQSIEDATALMDEQRSSFIDTATAAGMSRDAAEKLADQLGLTPAAVQTTFQSNVAAEKQRAEDYQNTLNKTPLSVKTDVNLNGIPDAEEQIRRLITNNGMGWHMWVDVHGDVHEAQNAIDGMNGRKVRVDFVGNSGTGITN